MKKEGFTLLELLVIMSIISLLSSIVLANVSQAREKGRDVKRLNDVRQIRTALELYYLDNNAYPETPSVGGSGPPYEIVGNCEEDTNWPDQESFDTHLQVLVDGGYINEIPKPPGYPNNYFPYCYFYVSPYFDNPGPCGGTEFALGFGTESIKLTGVTRPFEENDRIYCFTP